MQDRLCADQAAFASYDGQQAVRANEAESGLSIIGKWFSGISRDTNFTTLYLGIWHRHLLDAVVSSTEIHDYHAKSQRTWKVNDDEIWMLTVYGKNERDTIAAHILKQIAEEIKHV